MDFSLRAMLAGNGFYHSFIHFFCGGNNGCAVVSGYRLAVSVAVEEQFSMGYRSTESSLRKACLVRVRYCVAHRTLATALGFARCRHGKMFALSSDVPLHLIFKVLPLSPL